MTFLYSLLSLLILFNPFATAKDNDSGNLQFIDKIVHDGMRKGLLPGLSLVIIHDGQIIQKKGYGFANIDRGIPVTPNTLFELGSITKAFTGLTILKMESEGKIKLDSPLELYLPWFRAQYKKMPVQIKVQDCLFHTSGIPFHTISAIECSSDKGALEKTIRGISGLELISQPSSQFQYATINYDILGLLIQKMSQLSFEEYVKKEILQPLGMVHSILDRELAYHSPNMATGYKIGFLQIRPMVAPAFKGNIPAGYLISNAHDVGLWLKYQINPPNEFKELINKSHEPNKSVTTFAPDSFYATGWFLFETEKGQIFSHSGNNPNFSSYFSFSPTHKIAVGVMTNINSSQTMEIGQAVMASLLGVEPIEPSQDMLRYLDSVATIALCLLVPLCLFIIGLLVILLYGIAKRKRAFFSSLRGLSVPATLLLLISLSYIFYHLPSLLLWGLNWKFVLIWGPFSLSLSLFFLFGSLSLFLIYGQLLFLFPKSRNDRAPLIGSNTSYNMASNFK